MNNLLRLRTCSIPKWAFSNFTKNNLAPSKTIIIGTSFTHITQNPRFYSRKPKFDFDQKSNDLTKENNEVIEAQDALIEYLHSTRNLQFVDAENISRNSPNFLEKLLKSVESGKDAKQSLRRLFRYHPVNEFEPFFESMGIKVNEYSSLLPRDMMYLADDERMLSNYHVLCEYGVLPNKIGKIYVHAREVFGYGDGVLLSRLSLLQEKGFSQSCVAKLVTLCPNLLLDDGFLNLFEALTNLGILNSWFEENMLEGKCYDSSKILETLGLLKGFGFSKEELKGLLLRNPTVLLEDSGAMTVSVIVFLIKFGALRNDILSTFKQYPQIKIQTFYSNLKNGYFFLRGIEMENDDVANIIRTHSHVLGSCELKTVKTLLTGLKSGKKRLCEVVKENPLELKNWVLGKKVNALPKGNESDLYEKKIRFLLNLGFVEGSKEMGKALKGFRGNGGELQERFDCLVNAGLTHEAVVEMVKLAPHVMNQSKEVIEMKVDLLVNGLGYDVCSLVKFPAFLSYSVQKIKLRFAMYNWLTGRGKVNGNLALSTVLASTDKAFVRGYVHRDPEGLIVWDKFKKEFFPNEKVG